jgi:hypothetical protein
MTMTEDAAKKAAKKSKGSDDDRFVGNDDDIGFDGDAGVFGQPEPEGEPPPPKQGGSKGDKK